MARYVKKNTLLTGLAVAKYPREELTVLFERILYLNSRLPEDYALRRHVDKVYKDRLNIVKQNEAVDAIEEKIGCGQIEEVIVQARNQMHFMDRVEEWKPWAKPDEQVPPDQWVWPPHK